MFVNNYSLLKECTSIFVQFKVYKQFTHNLWYIFHSYNNNVLAIQHCLFDVEFCAC